MNKTPQSNRLTVSIFGACNSGKSSLFNAITQSEISIVSNIKGTTTDPVIKSMELLPHGPIVLIDTAGIGDKSDLGEKRVKKTIDILNRTDLAIYVIDSTNFNLEDYFEFAKEFEKRKIPCIVVMTKKDLMSQHEIHEDIDLFISTTDAVEIEALKELICKELDRLNTSESYLIKDLLLPRNVVILVAPIDREAPKGRLILPQVQIIRECLDNSIRCVVTTVDTLEDALNETLRIDLVVTDSQVFGAVDEIVKDRFPLTSFSILMARQKGDLSIFIEGVNVVKSLKDGDKILIAETCTHSQGHDDIGQVKIPKLLRKATGANLTFDFSIGRDYKEDLKQYKLIIHCGGCMITKKEMSNRIRIAEENKVPITNYGIILAYCNGILNKSIEIFDSK